MSRIGSAVGRKSVPLPLGGARKDLFGLAKILASTADLENTLAKVLDALSDVLCFDSASFFLLSRRELELVAFKGIDDPELSIGLRLDVDRFPLDAFIVDSGTPLLFADVSVDPRWAADEPSGYSALVRSWMGIPLSSSGAVIGMLCVDGKERGMFDEEDLASAKALADFAAIAVRNARLFSETRRRLKELDAVNRIGSAVASHLDPDELCEIVGANLVEIFRAGVVYVALRDEEAGLVRLPFYSHDGKRERYPPFAYGVGLASRVMETLEPIHIDHDLHTRGAAMGAVVLPGREALSWLGMPILSGRRAFGVLCVQSYEREGAFSEDDIRLLSTISATVGAGIRNALLYQEARRKAEEAAALADAGREISESLDLDVVLHRIAERAAALLTMDSAAVYQLEPDGSLRAVVAVGANVSEILNFPIPPGKGIVGRVVATGTGIIQNDVTRDDAAVPVPGTPAEEAGEKLMAAPLSAAGRVTGVMGVWRGADEAEFRQADLDFLSSLARQASVAIENARLHQRVTETAERAATLYDEAMAARSEAESANTMKSRFLANMTHELRTPLNSIINLAFLLQEGEGTPPTREVVDLSSKIEAAGRHLLGLINDVLDQAKIEAGKMAITPERTDFAQAARSVLAAVQGLPRAPGVALFDQVPDGLPQVLADKTRLRQILFNLLANAINFTSAGHVAVRARAEPEAIVVEVEDTGIGMDEADLPKAFSEFVQLDSDMDRRVGGSGLGLPISRSLVELQGGRIWARSRKGFGSTFSFTIPRADAATAAQGLDAGSAAAAAQGGDA
jgi:signal transduction histidine kinase